MSYLVLSREIYRPLEEVYAYHSDLTRGPEWWPNLAAITPLDGQAAGPAVKGARYSFTYNMIGRHFSGVITVTAAEPDARLSFEVKGRVDASFRYEYAATARTRTRVTVFIEYEAHGLFGKAVNQLFVEKRNAADAEHALDQLKEHLEAEAVARMDAGVV